MCSKAKLCPVQTRLIIRQGFHVQIIARSDRDLTPSSIIHKVSDASGSKYSGGGSIPVGSGPPPPVSSKPAFTPTRSSVNIGGFNPLASRTRPNVAKGSNVDADGWGDDAPPITRTQLEKVSSSYQPTTVNMRDLSSQTSEPSRFNDPSGDVNKPDVVRGAYQPVGKVDIAAIRQQSYQSGTNDDRPTVVKGAYEPVGKVDIAAIRARSQKPEGSSASPPTDTSPGVTESSEGMSTPFLKTERLTTLPKPKIANRFGSSTGSYTGTKAPIPSNFSSESRTVPIAPPAGVGRTFADQGGKTPAQLWAEKKAREREVGGVSDGQSPTPAAAISNQQSGGGQWKSGYEGKSWTPVATTRAGPSSGRMGQHHTGGEDNVGDGDAGEEENVLSTGGIGAIRDRFKGSAPMGAPTIGAASSPPPLDTSSKPNAAHGIPMPGLPIRPARPEVGDEGEDTPSLPAPPPQPPRSPTPPTPSAIDTGSPIRVAMPVGRGNDQDIEDAREEQISPPQAIPARSLAQAIPHEDDLTEEPSGHDPARSASEAAAATRFGAETTEYTDHSTHQGGRSAMVQYDYEKDDENEIELKEGERVTGIAMVDENWWMGTNAREESGLFPSNYVELIEGGAHTEQQPDPEPELHAVASEHGQGATATAIYDYEAVEENELTFPENAKIIGVVSFISFHLANKRIDRFIGISRRELVVWRIQWSARSISCKLCPA